MDSRDVDNESPVLVTGATGFIGRYVVKSLLDRGLPVVALHRPGSADLHVLDERAQPAPADLSDTGQLAELMATHQPSGLIHTAWAGGTGQQRMGSFDNVRWIEWSAALLNRFVDAGGKRAVMVGSCLEYALTEPVLSESSRCEPASLYGEAKIALRTVANLTASTTDLSLAWARPFFVYGPGEDPSRLIASVVMSLLAGDTPDCTDGLQERDFLHVADVGDALAAVYASDLTGDVNIAAGTAISVRDLVEIAVAEIGSGSPKFGAIERRPDDPAHLRGDTRRLNREVGWHPQHSHSSGIADTVEWFRTHQSLETQGSSR